jgi:hypothetical protein
MPRKRFLGRSAKKTTTRKPVSESKQLTSKDMKLAAKDILQDLLKVAREEGAREEARLGRPLTKAEAGRIADMIERQFQSALAMSR